MGIILPSSQKCHEDRMNGTLQALQEQLLKKNLNSQDCSLHSQVETTSKNSTVRIIARDKYLGHGSWSFHSPERGTTSFKGLQVFPSRGSGLGMWGPRSKTGTSRGKLKIYYFLSEPGIKGEAKHIQFKAPLYRERTRKLPQAVRMVGQCPVPPHGCQVKRPEDCGRPPSSTGDPHIVIW